MRKQSTLKNNHSGFKAASTNDARLRLRFTHSALALSICFAIGNTYAAQFSGAVIFGDSLSDGGWLRKPNSLPDSQGRFTTNPGLTAAEIIAARYGFATKPANDGGTNYAQGFQTASDRIPGITPPGVKDRAMLTQVNEYLTSTGGKANGDALYSMWAGSNDVYVTLQLVEVKQIRADQAQSVIDVSAADMLLAIKKIRDAGARYVVAYTLPDIGNAPAFKGTVDEFATRTLAQRYNSQLFGGLQQQGVEVIPIDAYALLREVSADPARYGLTNTTQPFCTRGSVTTCTAAQRPGESPDQYLYADGVQLASGGHKLLSQFVVSMIEAPGQMSLLPESAVPLRENQQRGIDRGIAGGYITKVQGLAPFAVLDTARFDLDSQRGSQALDSTAFTLTTGVAQRVTPSTVVGAALGLAQQDASFAQSLGGYKARDLNITGFGSGRFGNAYVTGKLAYGQLRFSDVERNITLGAATRNARSSAKGSNLSAQLSGGYDFKLGAILLGPIASFTHQSIKVKAFEESGAQSANLRFESQTRKSSVSSLGIRVVGDFLYVKPFARFTFERESSGGERVVTATPVEFSSGAVGSYSLPAYLGDKSWGTAQLGVQARVADRWLLGGAYTNTFSRSGVKAGALTFNASLMF